MLLLSSRLSATIAKHNLTNLYMSFSMSYSDTSLWGIYPHHGEPRKYGRPPPPFGYAQELFSHAKPHSLDLLQMSPSFLFFFLLFLSNRFLPLPTSTTTTSTAMAVVVTPLPRATPLYLPPQSTWQAPLFATLHTMPRLPPRLTYPRQ